MGVPSVTINLPGENTGADPNNPGNNIWQFGATVNGQYGIVTVSVPASYTQAEAAEYAQVWLEENPGDLGGVSSTPGMPDGSGPDDGRDDGRDDDGRDDDGRDDDDDGGGASGNDDGGDWGDSV